jgi:hypothetical protein
MRKILAVFAITAWASLQTLPAAADDKAAIAAIAAARAALGEAFKTDDKAAIRAIYMPDHLSVSSFYGKPLTVDEQLAAFSKLKESIVASTTPVIDLLGPATAEVTFENSFTGTYEGEPLPGRVFVVEIWVNRDGRWRQKLYMETPIKAGQ